MRKRSAKPAQKKHQKWLGKITKRLNTPYFFIILSCAIFAILIYFFQEDGLRLANRRAYQKHSAYAGIQSNFVVEQEWHLKSQREYPITPNQATNQQLAQKIDNIHQAYLKQLKTSAQKLSYKENTSFSVTYHRHNLLSISINAVQEAESGVASIITAPQTFDLTTGEVLKLSDVFTNPDYIDQRIMPELRRLVTQRIQQIKPDFNATELNQKLTAELVDNFLIHTDGNLQFEFMPGQFDSHHISKLVINLPATNYLSIIKPELRNRMFDQATIDLNSPESPQNRASFCAKNPCVALTFDDGPSQHTNRLLDILKTHNAKATFFVLGKNAEGHPDIVKRQIEEGHQIGYHGWNHTALNKLNPDQLNDELNRTDQILRTHNYAPKFTRPPYGMINQKSIDVLRDRGQDIALWSVDPRDWDIKDSDQIYSRVITANHNGAIILLHDIYPATIDSVEPIIKYLQDSGYSLVTVNTLLGDLPPSGSVYRKR